MAKQSQKKLALAIFQTDSCTVESKSKTLNIGVVGPNDAGKSEFIKYLIKDNDCKGFEITGSCRIRGLKIYYTQNETIILNVSEFRGSRDEQLAMAEREKLDVYFLFYDVSNLQSFKEVKNKWVVSLYERSQVAFVMGNKADMPMGKKVKTKMPDIPEEAWKTGHVEISSITGVNVNPFIGRAIEIMFDTDVQIQQELDLAQAVEDMHLALLPRKADHFYEMGTEKKGICVIINVTSFKSPQYSNREGALIDQEKLKSLFEGLSFEVQVYTNQDVLNIMKILMHYARDEDHTSNGAFVLFIMSHGREGHIVASNGMSIPVENIFIPFQDCAGLEGKPKMFFIQACQGAEPMQSGRSFQTDASPGQQSFNSARGFCSVPTSADFLIASSTVEGYTSHRTPDEGSVFIRVLVEEIENSDPGESLVDVLTRVNGVIAGMEFDNGNKQMTCFRSTLRKKVSLTTPLK